MKEITIKVIYDNCNANTDLQEGWGFSALIETGNRKILFDTGNDRDAFFGNAEKMGINLSEITDVLFSHKHDDHVAGCEEILGRLDPRTRVYLPKGFPNKNFPQECYRSKGLNEIGENIYSLVLSGGLFLNEQALIIQTEKGLAIITGCAHPGIVRILQTAHKKLQQPIYFVMGGFHLFRKKQTLIDKVVSRFQSFQVKQVAPCHCSGEQTIRSFQEAFAEQFYKIGTGSIVRVS